MFWETQSENFSENWGKKICDGVQISESAIFINYKIVRLVEFVRNLFWKMSHIPLKTPQSFEKLNKCVSLKAGNAELLY